MKINVLTIPHAEQRYPTVGDYWLDNDLVLQVRISQMGNANYEILVLLHELVELRWCEQNGIGFDAIDKFDREFEGRRDAEHLNGEPGDDPGAPYYQGHQIATALERTAAVMLGVDWQSYEAAIERL